MLAPAKTSSKGPAPQRKSVRLELLASRACALVRFAIPGGRLSGLIAKRRREGPLSQAFCLFLVS
jgi:hypothetical protein